MSTPAPKGSYVDPFPNAGPWHKPGDPRPYSARLASFHCFCGREHQSTAELITCKCGRKWLRREDEGHTR